MNRKSFRSFPTILLMVFALFSMVSCHKKYDFHTPQEAVTGCREMLSELKKQDKATTKDMVKVIGNWQEIQDSSYSVFAKDSNLNVHSKIASQYFVVSDSIRKEISRLAFSQDRTLEDVIYIKVNTASGREKVHNSDTWKKAVAFYDNLDKEDLYPNAKTTVSFYQSLLKNTHSFKTEKDLLGFIKNEDKCFRSVLVNLQNIPQPVLADLTAKTAKIFNDLYSRVGVKEDKVNDETMLFLTLRFNRRILQNAEVCRSDIKDQKKMDKQTRMSYRWMLLQPFVTIDNFSVACLTDKQGKEIIELAKELPDLLSYLDGQQGKDAQRDKMMSLLSTYFLRNFLLTTI